MSNFDKILAHSSDIFQAFYKHPFILAMQNQSLDKEKFRYYIIQDNLYLKEYLKTFAIGLSKSNNKELIKVFTNSILFLSQDEMKIHEEYLKILKITKKDFDNAKRHINNLSYTSYMLRIAYEESELEILSAVLSCAYSYELIAKNMVKNNKDLLNDEFFGIWVGEYISKNYSKTNENLINIFNKLSLDCSEEKLSKQKEIFRNCSKYELMFWDLAWDEKEII